MKIEDVPKEHVPDPSMLEWADAIAVDPSGEIYAFEGDCYWSRDKWIPVDDFDGLRFDLIGKLPWPVPPEVARTLYFSRIRSEESDGAGEFDLDLW